MCRVIFEISCVQVIHQGDSYLKTLIYLKSLLLILKKNFNTVQKIVTYILKSNFLVAFGMSILQFHIIQLAPRLVITHILCFFISVMKNWRQWMFIQNLTQSKPEYEQLHSVIHNSLRNQYWTKKTLFMCPVDTVMDLVCGQSTNLPLYLMLTC